VKRLVPLTLALLVLPSAALATAASHDEPERLNRADMTLAKRATIHKGDLAPAWRLTPSAPETGDRCPSFDPDLSAFVVTGKATTTFTHSAGAQIVSHVAVFRTVGQAADDFKASAKPALLGCLRSAVLQGLRAAHMRARITLSRMSTTPRVGAQSVSYRVIAIVSPTNGVPRFKMYTDFLAFRQGRSQAALLFMAPFAPIRGQAVLARTIARRLG
jgi:hypothetical protein